MIEEVVVHEVPIALVVLSGKTDVLVHIEGDDVLEGNLACLVHLCKSLINSERRRAGGETEHEGTVFLVVVYGVSNMLCRPITHCRIVVFNNKFHCFAPLQSVFLLLNYNTYRSVCKDVCNIFSKKIVRLPFYVLSVLVYEARSRCFRAYETSNAAKEYAGSESIITLEPSSLPLQFTKRIFEYSLSSSTTPSSTLSA